MNSPRFYLALWAGKFAQLIYGLSDYRDDHPGYFALAIDNDFIKKAAKPEYNLVITGTNGKTSTVNIVNTGLKNSGVKVACADWGGNARAVLSWTILKGDGIFNKPAVKFNVIEADELVARNTLPEVSPSHMIITNLGRDSMFRNANSEIPYRSLEEGIAKLPDCVLFLNGDDPVSCFLGENNKRIYFGVADVGNKEVNYISNDFPVCPKCGGIPKYKFHNYRHIGEFECPDCGLKSPEKDYLCTEIGKDYITVKEKSGSYRYHLISDTVYNIYNEVAIIAFFREIGYSVEKINTILKNARLPQIRESHEKVGNIEVIKRCMKGQNPSAAGAVLETLNDTEGTKEIILMVDEVPDVTGMETICWLWDTDFEFLNDPSIRKIIVCGRRHLDHKVRLLCAGIEPDKLVTVDDEDKLMPLLETEGIDNIFILHDVMRLDRSDKVYSNVVKYLKEKSL